MKKLRFVSLIIAALMLGSLTFTLPLNRKTAHADIDVPAIPFVAHESEVYHQNAFDFTFTPIADIKSMAVSLDFGVPTVYTTGLTADKTVSIPATAIGMYNRVMVKYVKNDDSVVLHSHRILRGTEDFVIFIYEQSSNDTPWAQPKVYAWTVGDGLGGDHGVSWPGVPLTKILSSNVDNHPYNNWYTGTIPKATFGTGKIGVVFSDNGADDKKTPDRFASEPGLWQYDGYGSSENLNSLSPIEATQMGYFEQNLYFAAERIHATYPTGFPQELVTGLSLEFNNIKRGVSNVLTASWMNPADFDNARYTVEVRNIAIDTVKAILAEKQATDYTSGSWSNLTSAIAALVTEVQKAGNVTAIEGAIDAVELAEQALVEQVDKAALINKIQEADNLVPNSAQYTQETWSVFTTKLSAAKTVRDNTAATQTQIDTALAELAAAINGLERADGQVNKTALDSLISECAALNPGSYTTESWAEFAAALQAAEIVSNDDVATQAEVNEAYDELLAAKNALVVDTTRDKTALQTAITSANAKIQTDYTIASWDIFTSAKSQAQSALNSPDVTQAQIDTATSNLNAAMAQLSALPAVKTDLVATIQLAEAKLENAHEAAGWAEFTSALQAAKVVNNNAAALQSTVDNARQALNNAMNALTPKEDTPVDKTLLNQLIIQAGTKQQADYTQNSYAALQSALTAANTINDKQDATHVEVSGVYTALNTAINGLISIVPLRDKIAQAEALTGANYTSESWTALQGVVTAAKVVLAKTNATGLEITNEVNKIIAAISALQPATATDKTDLKALIASVEDLDSSLYTTATWEAMQTKLLAAKEVDARSNALQSEVDEAIAALQAAADALALKTNVDKTALNAKITQAEAIVAKKSNYAQGNWSVLTNALAYAKSIAASDDKSQAQVDSATEMLNAAIVALVDISALKLQIEVALAAESKNYSKADWEILQLALADAEAVVANANATSTDVSNAVATLKAAVEATKSGSNCSNKVSLAGIGIAFFSLIGMAFIRRRLI